MTKGRFILTLSLSVAFHIAAAGAQQSGGKAAIEGVVLGAGTGAPLAGARVTLIPEAPVDQPFFQGPEELNVAPAFEGFAMPPSSSPTPPVVTDPQGRFAFTNVDAGSYRLYAEANGYVAQAYGPRQNMGTTLRLTAGQILSNIAFQMIPAGNVSGRIHDRDHHPLPGVPVQLLRATYTPMGQQVLEPAGVARTNDRGEYRLFWITPGRYYLKAGSPLGPDSFLVAMGGGGGQAETINPNEVPAEVATAFFPGAPNLAGASAIEVRAGGELTGIDWGLPSLPPTYRVRTRVMDSSTGQPPPAVQALIAPTPSRSADSPTEVSFDIAAAMSATQNYDPSSGVMEFPNIPPGVYTVSVMTVPFGPGLEFEGGRETALPDAGPVSPGFIPGVTNEAIEIPEPPPPVFPTAPEFIPQVSTGSTTVTVTDRNVEDAGITVTPAGSIAGHLQ
ncbi:MAG TPA: hypothetical protein VFY29_01540, partial [Terriglobia bacterium]|nr:hypothetical protein [Terriglobia bacterium]